MQKAQKHPRLETIPDETKIVPNELAKLEKKFPAVLPELVTFLSLDDALALLQTQKDYAQRAEQLFRRYGEFHLSNKFREPGQQFARWFFQTSETRPSVRILKLHETNNEILQFIPRCSRLQSLTLFKRLTEQDHWDMPAFPTSLQRVDVRINTFPNETPPEEAENYLRRAFLSSGQQYPKLENMHWMIAQRSVPPQDFQQWVSLVPALKTLTMSIDWSRRGVLSVLANLKQLEQVYLYDGRNLPNDGKVFDEDEIQQVCSIEKLKDLHLEMEDVGDDTVEWELKKEEEKKWSWNCFPSDDSKVNAQLLKDQIEFLKQKPHWSSVHLFVKEDDVQMLIDTLQTITKVCQGFSLTFDLIWFHVEWEIDKLDQDVLKHVLAFMQVNKCQKLRMSSYVFLQVFSFAEKRIGLHSYSLTHYGIVRRMMRALWSLGYSFLNFGADYCTEGDVRELLKQKQPIEELILRTQESDWHDNYDGTMMELVRSSHAKTLQRLTLYDWDPKQNWAKLGNAFPKLVSFHVTFSAFPILTNTTLEWVKQFPEWSFRNIAGEILASSAQSKSLEAKQRTSALKTPLGGVFDKPIEQVYDEYFNEKVKNELEADRKKSFPPPLTIEESQLAIRLANLQEPNRLVQARAMLGLSKVSSPAIEELLLRLWG